jgi:O-antigen/teichoic acid export membrane protein
VVFVFARHLTPADLGAFAIITAGVAFALLVMGLDFYVYSTREIPGADPRKIRSVILNHAAFLLGAYVVLGPFVLYAAATSPELASHLRWFVALTIAEHANQEVGRIIQVLGRATFSTVLLFLRSAAWVIVLVPVLQVNESARSLDIVLASWLAASTIALVWGASWIARTVGLRGGAALDVRWIRAGTKIAGLYFISTLLFRGVSSLDRFVVERLAGSAVVAKYALTVMIGMVIPNVADSAVMAYAFPRQIMEYRRGDWAAFKRVTAQSARSAAAVIVVLSAGAVVMGAQLGSILGNEHYQLPVQWVGLGIGAGALFAIGLLPHYVLYAANRDRDILLANVAGFVVFTAAVAAARVLASVTAVLVGITISYAVLLGIKTAFARRVLRRMQAPLPEAP